MVYIDGDDPRTLWEDKNLLDVLGGRIKREWAGGEMSDASSKSGAPLKSGWRARTLDGDAGAKPLVDVNITITDEGVDVCEA